MNLRTLCFKLTTGSLLSTTLIAAPLLFAQDDQGPMPTPQSKPLMRRTVTPKEREHRTITLLPGTKIPMSLNHPITTKTAREGDAVYARTNFPVVVEDQIVIPAGSYVQGVISRVQRAGRVKGRAEILVHFKTLIFPSGYTLLLPGAVDNVPGEEHGRIKDKEGSVQQEGTKGKDAGTIASTAGTGALIGAAAARGRGAAVGGAGGAVVGLASVLLTRGPDLRLERGATLETVLERPLDVDLDRAQPTRHFVLETNE